MENKFQFDPEVFFKTSTFNLHTKQRQNKKKTKQTKTRNSNDRFLCEGNIHCNTFKGLQAFYCLKGK